MSGTGPGHQAFLLFPSPLVPSCVVILSLVFSSRPSWKPQHRTARGFYVLCIGQGARVPASRGLRLLFILRSLIKGATSSSPDGVFRGRQWRGWGGDGHVTYRCLSSVVAQRPDVVRGPGAQGVHSAVGDSRGPAAGKGAPRAIALLGFSGGLRSGTWAPLPP